MTKIRIPLFLKFGQEEHIRDLYENGTIFINQIEFFRKLEDEQLRGDNYEGTIRLEQLKKDTPLILNPNDSKKKMELTVVKGQLREHYTSIRGNIYCLYAITPEMLKHDIPFNIDRRNKKFGTHFLLTRETRLFYNKIIEQINERKYEFRSNLVKYFDKEKYNGELTLFDKSNEFSYQSEFRILIRNNKREPIILNIGSMKEYAEVFDISIIDNLGIFKN